MEQRGLRVHHTAHTDDGIVSSLTTEIEDRSEFYNLVYDDLLDRAGDEEVFVPCSIFYKTSALSAVVAYLKDHQQRSFSNIARLLSRDPRTVWGVYNSKIIPVTVAESENIPLSIFKDRLLSPLEALVVFLKTRHTNKEIASLLGKDPRTIWTVLARARRKTP